MVVVCSVSALVRTTLFIVLLALVAGSPAAAEPVTH